VLLRTDAVSLRRIRQLGCVGSAALVFGAIVAGILPHDDPFADTTLIHGLRAVPILAVGTVFIGVGILLLAWWRLGTLVHRRDAPPIRDLAITLVWWSAPLIVATPIFSRDVYSYVAQGMMTLLGIDAYTFGPAILGAPLSLDVPPIWLHTPAPYGPVFLSAAADVTAITGESSRLGILGLRLLAWGGVALLVWSVPRLARAYGVKPQAALWLGVMNPLVVLHLVADAHNDALMLGLMCAGLAFALERRPAVGAVLVTLATLVKAPAALGLVFLVPIWVRQLSGGARWIRAGLATFALAAVTLLITTTAAGTGYGWLGALDTPTLAHTWTSITTDFGYWTGLAVEAMHVATMDQALAWWRVAGLLAAGVVCLLLLRRHERVEPVVGLGLGMGAVVFLGPVMHPWYLLWAIVPLAAAATSPRIRRSVTVVSIVFTMMVIPGGVQPSFDAFLGALLGVALVFAVAQLGSPSQAWARLRSGLVTARYVLQRQMVAVDSESADHAGRDRGDHRVVPEGFARVDVGDVHLDQRGGQEGARISHRIRIM
jgi:hypothetical protein